MTRPPLRFTLPAMQSVNKVVLTNPPTDCQVVRSPGRVFWITGLSGTGKTTIGRKLCSRLIVAGRTAVFLDGDELRQTIAEDLGHSAHDRLRSGMRNARICGLLASQGIDVVCATISLFHDVHRWSRANVPGYCEIYLHVPLPVLESRDQKDIYARARRGEAVNVVGIDVPAEEPLAPELFLENYGELTADAAVDRIWTELVVPQSREISRNGTTVAFGTKAETLERLAPALHSAQVLPQVRFTVEEWQRTPRSILARIASTPWGSASLIVRSSAKAEDDASASQAGKYDSVLNVSGAQALSRSIDDVISSYMTGRETEDQIFVQPMLTNLALAGVALTRDPNGSGPYFVINYDDRSGRTDLVTSGTGGELKTFVCSKSCRNGIPEQLIPIITLLRELESLLNCDAIDVEFAIDGKGNVYLLQVRQLATHLHGCANSSLIDAALAEIAAKVELLGRPHPYLHGRRTVFGVMPDWNPAEIIGLKPKPLALSIYRELITDAIWAYQRDNYGYKNLRSFPLLVSFHGLPYIDVRVSFNSFIPRDIEGELAERLANYYVDRLLAEPGLHDKVEFEIIFSCYSLDLPERLNVLKDYGFSTADRAEISDALCRLTNRIIHQQTGLWRQDRDKIDILAARLASLRDTQLDKVSRIYWLTEDCKRYGTLPFAGLARAGFIAVQLLRSLVTTGVIDATEQATFMASLNTVGSRIGRDFVRLSKNEFLEQYGHLRPGTYDILSPRYDEAPHIYFDWSAVQRFEETATPRFSLSIDQLRGIERLLSDHRLEIDPLDLMDFIKAGIEGREYAKFVFTKTLSDTLSLIKRLGEDHGLTLEDAAFLDFSVIRSLYNESASVGTRLRASVNEGRRRYELTRRLVLPPIITSRDDVFAFHFPSAQPNFITEKSITAAIAFISDSPEKLEGSIVFIPSADPGFDWIFTRGICGFVTEFGGVNSHMAIRAGELGVPAVIGAGEVLFKRWQTARKICLNCANRQVQLIQ